VIGKPQNLAREREKAETCERGGGGGMRECPFCPVALNHAKIGSRSCFLIFPTPQINAGQIIQVS